MFIGIAVVMALVLSGLRIAQEYQRGVVFRESRRAAMQVSVLSGRPRLYRRVPPVPCLVPPGPQGRGQGGYAQAPARHSITAGGVSR